MRVEYQGVEAELLSSQDMSDGVLNSDPFQEVHRYRECRNMSQHGTV